MKIDTGWGYIFQGLKDFFSKEVEPGSKRQKYQQI
jgi:hypothetical protein